MSQEDIEATKAPLMDHLIELRSRLIKALIAFVITFALCFFFAKQHLQRPGLAVRLGRGRRELELHLHGAAGIFHHPAQALDVRRGVHLVSGGRVADLHVRRARPLSQRAQGVPAVSDRDADLLHARRGGGLFPRDADAGAVLARHAAAGRRRQARDRAAAEGRRISLADDVADPRFRRRLPASGHPDVARPRRHHHLGAAKAKRRYFIVGAFVIAAVLTPPDVISQMSLAIPLLLLFEGSIWSVRMVEKRAAREEAGKTAAA